MKKLILTVIISFILICNLYSQSGWQIQYPPASQYFMTVFFLNENTGWIANMNYLLKTTNKGVNWIILSNNFGIDVTDIQFMDELTGYAVGSSGLIRKTTNGGLNWFVPNCPECYSYDDFMQILFLDGNTGYAFGDQRIFKSTDTGLNWSPLECNLIINRGQFLNSSTGWVVGLGAFAKTTSGGVNWVQNHFTNNWTNDVFFINFNTGWIVSYSGDIFKTTNTGDNWTLQYKDSIKKFNDIVFTSNDTGWATGRTVNSGSGFVLKTTNAGLNWFNQQVPNTEYYEIFMLNSNEGWIAGNYLLHTTDGGGTVGIKQILSEIPEKYYLEQNYPNPFNQCTMFNLRCSMAGRVKVSVYDISGKEVAVLVNEELKAGVYEVRFDAGDLPSGIYFYRMETENFTETKKLILLK